MYIKKIRWLSEEAEVILDSKGSNGVKKLAGKGIKGFMYEAKVVGKEGAYRLLGNIDDTGNIIWEVFEKVHK